MGSLDGLQKAAAPDFFYTRLSGRMQREIEPAKKPYIMLHPAFVTAALSVVFIINIFSLVQFNKQTTREITIQTNNPASIENFAEAYALNSETVYE